jgi:hypothetical protein
MKDYLVGIVVLAAILLLLVKVTLGQVINVNSMKKSLDSAKFDYTTALSNSQSKNRQLVLQFGNDDISKFMNENAGTLKSMMEIGSINELIGSESEKMGVPIQEQKTNSSSIAGRPNSALPIVQVHEYSISILCSFRDSLQWLGKIEDAFPYARVESIVYTPSGDYVNLQTKIMFPKLDPTVFAQ